MYCGEDNCYSVLGVGFTATPREIKSAYRKLSLEFHPDREGGDEAQFVKVAAANEILSDPTKRSDYDYFLAHPEERLYNSYRYYRAQTDLRAAWTILVILFSILHYGLLWERYQRNASRLPAIDVQVQQIMSSMARPNQVSSKRRGKPTNKNDTADIAMIRKEVLAALDREGVFVRPRFTDIFIIAFIRNILQIPTWWKQRQEAKVQAMQDQEEQKTLLERREQEEQEKREAAKQRIQNAQKEREEALQRQRDECLAQVKAAAEAEALAKKEKDERQQLATDISKYAQSLPFEEFTLDDIKYLNSTPAYSTEDLNKLMLQLRSFVSSLGSAKVYTEQNPDLDKFIVKIRKQARKLYQSREQELLDLSGSRGSGQTTNSTPWSEAELAVLAKALAKFPGGTRNRWLTISNMVNMTSCSNQTRSEQDCATQAAKIKNFVNILGSKSSPANSGNSGGGGGGSSSNSSMGENDSTDSWTPAEQMQLEAGLSRFAKLSDVKEKWQSIAAGVPSRSAKECAQRFQSIRAAILGRQKEGSSLT